MTQTPFLANLQRLRLIETGDNYLSGTRRLGIAHPYIQRSIKRLEQNLGIPLNQPSIGRIELSPRAARLIVQLNHQLDSVSEIIKAAQSEPTVATTI